MSEPCNCKFYQQSVHLQKIMNILDNQKEYNLKQELLNFIDDYINESQELELIIKSMDSDWFNRKELSELFNFTEEYFTKIYNHRMEN